jgi:hypothetical protein
MNIAIVNTEGQIVKSGDYRAIFPNTSFRATGPSDEFLAENSAMRVDGWKPHNEDAEKLVPCAPYVENGRVYVVKVEPISQADTDAKNQLRADEVRAERNQKLAESDWTQLPDAKTTVNTEAWALYRQQLRNITEQPGFPWNVEWPVRPV